MLKMVYSSGLYRRTSVRDTNKGYGSLVREGMGGVRKDSDTQPCVY